jgi:type IV secretory pathway VirB6-like protein
MLLPLLLLLLLLLLLSVVDITVTRSCQGRSCWQQSVTAAHSSKACSLRMQQLLQQQLKPLAPAAAAVIASVLRTCVRCGARCRAMQQQRSGSSWDLMKERMLRG